MKKFLLMFFALFLIFASARADAALPMQRSFAPLVKKTSPSVVNIYTKKVVTERTRSLSPFFNDPFFNQFFGRSYRGRGRTRQRVENSLGSGVIVDRADRIIATSNHVVKGATEITVVTHDGQEFEAKKLLEDPKTDLAILELSDKEAKLPALNIADSDDVEVGDIVLAIGNPFGVGQTVTSGIVSGVARTDVGIADYGFFIQTDAAINPGNSGGALIDIDGNLIGINTAIFSKSGGSLGIGFAIPANMVKSVIKAAKGGGKMVRPWMGITSQEVSADMVEALELDKVKGAIIKSMHPESPAIKAGLKKGDVIISINGKEVLDPSALRFRLATVHIGEEFEMGVIRHGEEFKVSMRAESAPETTPREETLIKGNNILTGAVVANISPALLEEFTDINREAGVVVIEMKSRSAMGVRKGDIIQSINGKKVESVKQLLNLLKNNKSRKWSAVVQRGKSTLNLTIYR